MRNVFIVVVFAFFIQCSPSSGAKEGSAMNESIDTLTTTNDSLLLSEEPSDRQSTGERDTSDLNLVYDEKRENTLTMMDVYYQVSISNKQYEAVSDVTWYFDGNFSPRYFSLAWSAEGNDGTTELIIEEGAVICGTKQEYNTTTKWCNNIGGTSMTWEEETETPSIELLPMNYRSTLNDELNEFLTTLKHILNEVEVTTADENLYTLKKEVEVNYGSDFTETLKVTIPKELYNHLKGN